MKNDSSVKDREYALQAIDELARGNSSASARKRMAEAAIQIGNYDESGITAWREYLDSGCERRG